jgi:hypothetical protein
MVLTGRLFWEDLLPLPLGVTGENAMRIVIEGEGWMVDGGGRRWREKRSILLRGV